MATAHSLLSSVISTASDLWDHVDTLESRRPLKDRLQQIRDDLGDLLDDAEGGEV